MPIEWNPRERERFRLYMLGHVYAIGLVNVLQRYVLKWAEDLRNSVSQNVQEEFAWFEREAARCAAVEAEHGKGSLLNLDHRFVKSSMTITPAEFEAARRYHPLTGKAA